MFKKYSKTLIISLLKKLYIYISWLILYPNLYSKQYLPLGCKKTFLIHQLLFLRWYCYYFLVYLNHKAIVSSANWAQPIKVIKVKNIMNLCPKKLMITIRRWKVSGRETSQRFVGFKTVTTDVYFLSFFHSDSIVSVTEVGNISSPLNTCTQIKKKNKLKTTLMLWKHRANVSVIGRWGCLVSGVGFFCY